MVNSLRNNDVVRAEYFTSVSISFITLEGFINWTATVSPETAMALLSSIQANFDEVVSMFRVFKVEAINDSYMVRGVQERVG